MKQVLLFCTASVGYGFVGYDLRRQASSDASCATILCQINTQCVNGRCVPLDNDVMCTMDAKICPDGSSVGRQPPSCAFAPCPSSGSGGVMCTMEVNTCPDGSSVGRVPPSCAFAPCPTSGKSGNGKNGKGKFGKTRPWRRQAASDASSCATILCQENTECVDGECRPLDKCAYMRCAGQCLDGKCIDSEDDNNVVCTLDAKICPDGSSVGRQPPNCEFAPCPSAADDVMCTMDAKICPDGSSVGRQPPSCAFAPCPNSPGKAGRVGKGGKFGKGKNGVVRRQQDASSSADAGGVMCTMEVKTCPDGSFVGRSPPDCAFRPCPGSSA